MSCQSSSRGFESLPVRGPHSQWVFGIGDNDGDNGVSAEADGFPRVARPAKRLEVRRVEPLAAHSDRADVVDVLGWGYGSGRSHGDNLLAASGPNPDAIAVANRVADQVAARVGRPSRIVPRGVPDAAKAAAFVWVS